MNSTQIALEDTKRFNLLITDYVKSDEKLADFYSLPHEIGSYQEQIENRGQFSIDRELLATALLQQYKAIGGCEGVVLENVEALREDNTFTVTTGHQLNIFTGPLYFIYKIFHTIRLAEALQKKYPNQKLVPVYWMNAEDHDLEEIGQFNLFGKKYTWNTDQTGATGKMNPKSLSEFCDDLEKVFSNNTGTLGLVEIFRKAYSEFDDLATSTRYFANLLFGKYGLVIIDGDDSSLKSSFTEFLKRDIINRDPFESVKSTSLKLKRAGYSVQVNPREINSFYLIDGIRNRLVPTKKGYHVLHTEIRFTTDELLAELKAHPERFSPNVVLRPLYQEHILPNLAYVGGAGELSYWLQYKNYFKEMNVSFPILALRNHFVLIDGAAGKKMDELKLLPQDLFHSVDELVSAHLFEVSDTELDLSYELKQISDLYASLKAKATEADGSLVGAIEAEEKKQQNGVKQWGSRFSRAIKKKNEVSVNQLRKIHSKLFPLGYLQERHDNFLQFHSLYGDDFMDEVYENTNPFSMEFSVLRLG